MAACSALCKAWRWRQRITHVEENISRNNGVSCRLICYLCSRLWRAQREAKAKRAIKYHVCMARAWRSAYLIIVSNVARNSISARYHRPRRAWRISAKRSDSDALLAATALRVMAWRNKWRSANKALGEESRVAKREISA